MSKNQSTKNKKKTTSLPLRSDSIVVPRLDVEKLSAPAELKGKPRYVEVPIHIHSKDDQAGGFDMTCYGTEDEAIAAKMERGWDGTPENDDEYEYGELSEQVMTLRIDETGKVTLASPLWIHCGQ